MISQFDFEAIEQNWRYLFETGMVFTLQLTAMAMVGGIAFGTFLAMMRLSQNKLATTIAACYVNFLRSIPLVLVIFWFYFLVPLIGAWVIGAERPIQVGAFTSALIAFILFEAAFYCEIIRAGIQSIPRGQIWAAQALGMNSLQTMRNIILPQAFRNMLPVLITQTIILLQDVSLVYVLSMTDFVGAAVKVGQLHGRLVESLIFVAVVYFFMCFALSQLVSKLQRRLGSVK